MNAPYIPTRRDVNDARSYARRLRAATRRVGRYDPVPANLLARLNAKRRAGFGLDYFLNEYAAWLDHNARAGLYVRSMAA